MTEETAKKILNSNPFLNEILEKEMQKDAELKEKKENLRIIYDMISDLWDYVDDLADYECHEWIKPCILEKLQDMQQYAK